MDEQISVMILGGNPDIGNSLKTDLEVLGLKPSPGRYPDIYTDIFKKPTDVILVDLTMCDQDALLVCELLLREGVLPPETALVALLSEATIGQIPMDYKFADIIKLPYDIAEFGFRLRRVVYLNHREFAGDTIRIGNLSISPSRYEVKVGGQPAALSHKEYELFKYLITHPNRVFTRENLLTSIWGRNPESSSRTVDVHIRRVRAKIGDIDQIYIRTVRGVGYTFCFRDE
jgi:DNA-binding response OmpR family regulator